LGGPDELDSSSAREVSVVSIDVLEVSEESVSSVVPTDSVELDSSLYSSLEPAGFFGGGLFGAGASSELASVELELSSFAAGVGAAFFGAGFSSEVDSDSELEALFGRGGGGGVSDELPSVELLSFGADFLGGSGFGTSVSCSFGGGAPPSAFGFLSGFPSTPIFPRALDALLIFASDGLLFFCPFGSSASFVSCGRVGSLNLKSIHTDAHETTNAAT
jgi:hypothetical protein